MKEMTQQTIFGLTKKQTGYSIYSHDAKKRIKQNTLDELYPKLPNEKFDVIYADPPWDYNGKLQFDKSSASFDKIDFSRKIVRHHRQSRWLDE